MRAPDDAATGSAGRTDDQLSTVRRRLSATSGVALADDPARCAAVLLALSGPSDDLSVTLTRRAERLNAHAGEVALPGGKHEPGDSGLDATALREAEEEIGLPASAVEILGPLEPLRTIRGLCVAPFVGVVPALPALSANAAELDCIFHAPLRFFVDPGNLLCDEYALAGAVRRVPRFHYDGFAIWGFTASVLTRFCVGALGAPLDLRRAVEVINRIDLNGADAERLNRVSADWRPAGPPAAGAGPER